jgi:uncharacterized protein YidB (DUF937 family)
MGLLDIINGMQNGPRGQTAPAQPGKGGMSPIAMALIGVLAYKAIKHMGAGQTAGTPAPNAAPNAGPLGGGLGGALSGGLGGLLSGPLGGLLAGGAAGGLVSGGLNDLLKQFQQGGQGGAVQSWIGTGPNQEISPNDLSKALGEDQIKTIMEHSGMSRSELLAALSQHLPELINQLTPNGRIPTEQEASRLS